MIVSIAECRLFIALFVSPNFIVSAFYQLHGLGCRVLQRNTAAAYEISHMAFRAQPAL